jgi:hypothetical protein
VSGTRSGGQIKKAEQRQRKRRMTHRRVLWAEAAELCGNDPRWETSQSSVSQALQLVLDRAMGSLYVAATFADDVPVDEFWVRYWDAQGNVRVEPNKWYKLEAALREEVHHIAADMMRLGIAERLVEVEERKSAWVLAAIRAAASDAGLDNDQVRKLGEGIRKRLVEGTAVPEVAA